MRRLMLITFLAVISLAQTVPAWAVQDTRADDEFVVLSGPANVPEGQQVGDVVVFHGSSNVAGTVNGSLTAFDAPVTISGRVTGDVVVFNGPVILQDGANVAGDVVSRNAPRVAPGATIGGETRRVQTNFNWEGFGWAGRLAWWIAISVSTLVVGLVLFWLIGRGANRIEEAGRTGTVPSIAWGLALFFGLPILAIVALVSLVGIPLGLGVLAGLGMIYALGYSASAWVLGRTILRGPTAWIVVFLVGWAILRVAALIPILGGLVWFVAVVFGLGVLVVAVWRARSAPQTAPATP
jgi:cytoskeletal protein CcmA (bactofilin family)